MGAKKFEGKPLTYGRAVAMINELRHLLHESRAKYGATLEAKLEALEQQQVEMDDRLEDTPSEYDFRDLEDRVERLEEPTED